MNHFIHLDYRLLISHISSWNYQAVQIIEYSRKAQIQSQEEVIQFVRLILGHRMSIGLCNRDRYILIYKLMFPPDLLHRRLKLLMLQVFLIYANFSRVFHSAILYDLSAILGTYRLAFRLYNTLKIRSTGSFSCLAILQYSKYCRFSIVHLVWTREYRIFWLY